MRVLFSFLLPFFWMVLASTGMATTDVSLDTLLESLKASLTEESSATETLSTEAEEAKQKDKAMRSEGRAHRILAASHRNLLLSPQTATTELEKGRAEHQTILNSLEGHLQYIQRQWESLDTQRLHTENRKKIISEQKTAIVSQEASTPQTREIQKTMASLLDILGKKTKLLETMLASLEKRREDFIEIRTEMTALSAEFEQVLKGRRTSDLFQKDQGFRAFVDINTPTAIFEQIRNSVLRILSPDFWHSEIRPLFQLTLASLVRILILSLLLFPVTFRIRFFLKKMEGLYPDGWLGVLLETGRKTMPFIVLALFTESVIRSQPGLSATGLFKAAAGFIWFVAIYRLLTVFPAACKAEGRPSLPGAQLSFLHKLTRVYIVFAPVFILSVWFFPPDSPLLIMERILMEISIIFLVFRFWKDQKDSGNAHPFVRTALRFTVKAIALGAPALEFLGYGSLALFWYWAWGITLTSSGLYLLFFVAMREWHQKIQNSGATEDEDTARLPSPRVRLGLRVLPFLVLPLPVFVIAKAWELHETLIPGLMAILRYPLSFGNMELSLLRLIQALLVLLFTLFATRFLRAFIEKRILSASGVEQGLQASILTLIGYVFWGIGILTALHVFGLNTTSLTVAFGALGVGLGFGLQAIFNNFVSGIILLFERPIQVGDVIEIDGIWGSVTRINVRSTVVQTYDNASLIIPNATFISNRLTNWSFKDQRLRKNVDVGVSYGSDVKLVETILLEVACNTKGVLVYPAPDVHFMDFGDSALVFRLRFWSTLQDFRRAETDIRFAITDAFRKAGIEIPFPQRDLHLRSDFRVEEKKEKPQESGGHPEAL